MAVTRDQEAPGAMPGFTWHNTKRGEACWVCQEHRTGMVLGELLAAFDVASSTTVHRLLVFGGPAVNLDVASVHDAGIAACAYLTLHPAREVSDAPAHTNSR